MFLAATKNQPTFFLAQVLQDNSIDPHILVKKYSILPPSKHDRLIFQRKVISDLPDCKSYDPSH